LEWRTPALEQVLIETDLLMVEIAELGDRERGAQAFEARAFDVNLPPILDRVPEGERAALATSLEAAGIDPDALVHTETWAAAMQLGNAISCFDAANGVDRNLLRESDETLSLESHARQFAAFDGLPADAQVALLLTVSEESDCRTANARVEAWLVGDIEALEASILAGFRGNAALRETLVDIRNEAYADRIADYQANEPNVDLLVAVGAGHMVGESGLPALLSERGYTLRRIQ